MEETNENINSSNEARKSKSNDKEENDDATDEENDDATKEQNGEHKLHKNKKPHIENRNSMRTKDAKQNKTGKKAIKRTYVEIENEDKDKQEPNNKKRKLNNK